MPRLRSADTCSRPATWTCVDSQLRVVLQSLVEGVVAMRLGRDTSGPTVPLRGIVPSTVFPITEHGVREKEKSRWGQPPAVIGRIVLTRLL
jgi:hypothetical protein